MNKMVERVSRAIDSVILIYRTYGRENEGYHIVDRRNPGPESVIGITLWRDTTPFARYNEMGLDRVPRVVAEALRRFKAEAAIEAMREPSKEMLEAADRVGIDQDPTEYWPAMIDAALKDE